MKKISALALIILTCVGFIGCVETSESSEKESSPSIKVQQQPEWGYAPIDDDNSYFHLDHVSEELLAELEHWESIIEFEDENYSIIALRPKSHITDFQFYQLIPSSESTIFLRKGDVIYTIPQFDTDNTFIVDWGYPGILPQRGISFTDDMGEEHFFTLSISGEDGTIYLMENCYNSSP